MRPIFFCVIIKKMSGKFAKLEEILGYSFQNQALIERALTHRSFAYEKSPLGKELEIRNLHNETFEFVGDSVLGLSVAEYLFLKHPELSEGDLTLMKHRLVSAETLAKIGQKLNIGEFMQFGKGEERTGGRRKDALLADTLEAIIAAVFLDSNYVTARGFVHQLLHEEMQTITPTSALDYKTLLQEKLQAEKRSIPKYSLIKHEGPSHKRTFYVEVDWETGKAQGVGKSIKSAEMKAAQEALEKFAEEMSA
jgi:ribonuclease III